MMAYVKKQKVADVTFNVFALCWVVSRIGLLPYRIIYFSSYVALGLVPMFSAYYIFNGLLIALQTLHIIWTFFIIKVAIHAWNNNGVSGRPAPLAPCAGNLYSSSPFSLLSFCSLLSQRQIRDIRSDDEDDDEWLSSGSGSSSGSASSGSKRSSKIFSAEYEQAAAGGDRPLKKKASNGGVAMNGNAKKTSAALNGTKSAVHSS